MDPIPETAAALRALESWTDEAGLLDELRSLARRARELVPDLVGVSVSRISEELTFTLVASDLEVAVLDAVQYLAGGPCVEGGEAGEVLEVDEVDLLDEEGWRLFAQATAARTVRSTLTLPVLLAGRAVGSINLYAASAGAFGDVREQLASLFGAWAEGAVTNADLSFATREAAQRAPEQLRARAQVDQAIGVIAASQGIDAAAAERRLRTAAAQAGVSVEELAELVIEVATPDGDREDREG